MSKLLTTSSLTLSLLLTVPALAKLNVVTTTTTLAALTQAIGGEQVDITSLTVNNQDPHFVEAKPSYMVKLRHADLLVSVGMELEKAWIESVRRGARNPKLLPGQPGHFEAGDFVLAIEVPKDKVDRAQGDVHPSGNPHFHLDPLKTLTVSKALSKKLQQLLPDQADYFKQREQSFENQINEKLKDWTSRIHASGIQKVFTYHKSLNYFLNRFEIETVATIEPLPGVPPSAKHILYLIETLKEKKVHCILNENYFEITPAQRLKKEVPVHIEKVPVEAAGDYFELIDRLVSAVESCGKFKGKES